MNTSRVLAFLLFIFCVFVYLTFSLPWYVDLVVVAALAIVALRSTWRELALVATSGVVLAVSAQIAFLSPILSARLFYREHEKWYRNDSYRPGVTDAITIPFGDLVAADPSTPSTVVEPRKVEFATDSLGFRNRSDYAGQQAVLVGDSFVVGMGTDQRQILPELLTTEFGLPTYALGFPSAPKDYEARAKTFLPRLAPRALYGFMVFEGNDFEIGRPVKVGNLYDRARGRFLQEYLPFLAYPKILFGMSRRAQAMLGLPPDTWVEVHQVGPKAMAFSRFYIDGLLAATQTYVVAGDKDVMARMGCVFFIPDKYRVYKEYISDGRQLPEPPPGLMALEAYYKPHNVPVVDLTPAMREAARSLLPQAQYIFWRDDTHWNANGMRAVAPAVKDCLASRIEAAK